MSATNGTPPKAEEGLGAPDAEAWRLWDSALEGATKLDMVCAYHVICAASGRDITFAQANINTYTKALYLSKSPGDLTSEAERGKPDSYGQPALYGFFYGSGTWHHKMGGRSKRRSEVLPILRSPWAQHVCQALDVPLATAFNYAKSLSW